MKNLLSICLLLSASLSACAQDASSSKEEPVQKVSKPEEEWKTTLDAEQFRVLRKKGTERPYSGKYDQHFEPGAYTCAGCGEVLFVSNEKFDAGCGWPSFSDAEEGKVNYEQDVGLGMMRTEITCANCGGHLGHVFDDGPTETGQRYCVNSVSLDFEPGKGQLIKNDEEKK